MRLSSNYYLKAKSILIKQPEIMERAAVIQLLFESKADPNQARDNGMTPLFAASKEGHEQIVQLLLEKKANPNKADEVGTTPLSISVDKGYLNIVRHLLEAKADPKDQRFLDKSIPTADLIAFAKKKNINIDNTFWKNKTHIELDILQVAVFYNNPDLVTILLTENFDPLEQIEGFPNAVKLAQKMGYTHIEKLLKEHGKNKQKEKSPLAQFSYRAKMERGRDKISDETID